MGSQHARPTVTRGLTLDAGALLALEKRSARLTSLLSRVDELGLEIAIPAPVLAQVWRQGARQVRLVRLIGSSAVEVVAFDGAAARATGVLLGRCRAKDGAKDVVDASVVLCARQHDHSVVTSAPEDLAKIDPRLAIIAL